MTTAVEAFVEVLAARGWRETCEWHASSTQFLAAGMETTPARCACGWAWHRTRWEP